MWHSAMQKGRFWHNQAPLSPVTSNLQTLKRGRALVLRIGDAEVEYDPRFRLYLQTKISNPHYRPGE